MLCNYKEGEVMERVEVVTYSNRGVEVMVMAVVVVVMEKVDVIYSDKAESHVDNKVVVETYKHMVVEVEMHKCKACHRQLHWSWLSSPMPTHKPGEAKYWPFLEILEQYTRKVPSCSLGLYLKDGRGNL